MDESDHQHVSRLEEDIALLISAVDELKTTNTDLLKLVNRLKDENVVLSYQYWKNELIKSTAIGTQFHECMRKLAIKADFDKGVLSSSLSDSPNKMLRNKSILAHARSCSNNITHTQLQLIKNNPIFKRCSS